MRTYLKNLKNHSGLNIAFLFTIIFIDLGICNESMTIKQGAIFGFAMSVITLWLPVLLTTKRK